MSAKSAKSDLSGALAPSGDTRSLVAHWYDSHGIALYRLAYALCGGDRDKASTAVAQAFARAAAQPSLLDGGRAAPELARLTYVSCANLFPAVGQSGDEDQRAVGPDASRAWLSRADLRRRALLALTMYGNFTYHEAASMLHLEPASAAELLRTALRESAQLGSDGSPDDERPR